MNFINYTFYIKYLMSNNALNNLRNLAFTFADISLCYFYSFIFSILSFAHIVYHTFLLKLLVFILFLSLF